jgi:hypothetical protein
MIPNDAVEAAAVALFERDYGVGDWGITNEQVKAAYMDEAKTALEYAAPYMLSHERQLTADAHRDAIVNRDTVDRLEEKLADVWDEGYSAGKSDEFAADKGFTGYHTNPYRSQA